MFLVQDVLERPSGLPPRRTGSTGRARWSDITSPIPEHELRDIRRERAAVLIGDIVAYSRLVEEDLEGTVLAMNAIASGLLYPLAQRHRARLCQPFGGDGVLMGFANPADAIGCALALPHRLAAVVRSTPFDRRIRLRLGLSYGEVLSIAGSIYGTPVNVAARLQTFAEPESVCVCGGLVAAARPALRLDLEALGPRHLKNIEKPVEVYRLIDARPHVARRAGDEES